MTSIPGAGEREFFGLVSILEHPDTHQAFTVVTLKSSHLFFEKQGYSQHRNGLITEVASMLLRHTGEEYALAAYRPPVLRDERLRKTGFKIGTLPDLVERLDSDQLWLPKIGEASKAVLRELNEQVQFEVAE